MKDKRKWEKRQGEREKSKKRYFYINRSHYNLSNSYNCLKGATESEFVLLLRRTAATL